MRIVYPPSISEPKERRYDMTIVTHGDLDGLGAAVLLCAMQDEARTATRVEVCDYDTIDAVLSEILDQGTDSTQSLYITDICPSKDVCERLDMAKQGGSIRGNLWLFDHHATKSWVKEYPWATFDTEECGTSLVGKIFDTVLLEHSKHKHFRLYENAVYFTNAVRAWDLWQLNSPYRAAGEDFNNLLRFMGHADFLNQMVNYLFLHPSAQLLADPYAFVGHYLRERKKLAVQGVIGAQLLGAPYHMDENGLSYKILFASDNTAEVGHAAMSHPESVDLHYVAVVQPIYNKVSLYTNRPDVHVGEIAKKRGGGGHPGAAGFTLKLTNHLAQDVAASLSKG